VLHFPHLNPREQDDLDNAQLQAENEKLKNQADELAKANKALTLRLSASISAKEKVEAQLATSTKLVDDLTKLLSESEAAAAKAETMVKEMRDQSSSLSEAAHSSNPTAKAAMDSPSPVAVSPARRFDVYSPAAQGTLSAVYSPNSAGALVSRHAPPGGYGPARPRAYASWPEWKKKKWDWQHSLSPHDKEPYYHYDKYHPDKAFVPEAINTEWQRVAPTHKYDFHPSTESAALENK